jgi:single-strand DNA-binding protein
LRRRDRETGEWTDGPTSFVTVQCWRALAENVHMSVHKGEPVLVTGRLQIRRFEDLEGAPRTAAEIEATSVGHDLTRGVAKFSRTRWPAAAEAVVPSGEPGPGNGAELPDGLEPGKRPATGGDRPAGDGVIDEHAVADFARELGGSLGTEAAADPGAGARAEAEVGVPA